VAINIAFRSTKIGHLSSTPKIGHQSNRSPKIPAGDLGYKALSAKHGLFVFMGQQEEKVPVCKDVIYGVDIANLEDWLDEVEAGH